MPNSNDGSSSPDFLCIREFSSNAKPPKVPVPGYFICSTAPDNVEEGSKNCFETRDTEDSGKNCPKAENSVKDASKQLQLASIEEIATQLNQENAELVIAIHGYNTSEAATKAWYRRIWDRANESESISGKFVFVGYRWPSEQFLNEPFDKIKQALSALPIPLWVPLYGGMTLALISLLVLKPLSAWGLILLIIAVGGVAVVAALMFLRISVYFRDAYRASNFGTPDLVEFLRQLDKTLLERGKTQDHKVKLNFVCHSMGAFVTTSAVRILSDVFDPSSVGTLYGEEKLPSPAIGNIFSLGRLVLVAPDIPVETIRDGRANFLKSSLRRFEEAYLFSNEGDLALRIASTVANYLSYPAKTRASGYRLGNLGVRAMNAAQTGIVNLENLLADPLNKKQHDLGRYLELSILNRRKLLTETASQSQGAVALADRFTYFDCTDYRDYKYKKANSQCCQDQTPKTKKLQRLLSLPLPNSSLLRFLTYNWQMFLWLVLRRIDVHGGYFEGEYCSQLIYDLAFLSFGGYLESLPYDQPPDSLTPAASAHSEKFVNSIIKELKDDEKFKAKLEADPDDRVEVVRKRLRRQRQFSQAFAKKGIQVALSPERYQVDVLLRLSREEYREEILKQ